MGTRYYDPSLGRFTQVDPIAGGSANAYDYANCDPVNQADPNGTMAAAAARLLPFIIAVAAKSLRIAVKNVTRAQWIACGNAASKVWEAAPGFLGEKGKVVIALPGMIEECIRAIRSLK